jgi:hypothetical protein
MGMEDEGVMRVLEKGAVKRYLRRGGVGCLFCGSPGVEGESVDIGQGGATQRVSCAACGGSWTDCYKMDSVVLDED